MFEEYKKTTNKVFMENPLINSLAQDINWTVSDMKKRPVDARHLLETNQVRNARIFNEPYPLVSLIDLNENENLQATNRTYRLQAQDNNVIVIDVEPEASGELLQFAVDFPAHLTEISTNGGVHLLIKVPESIITDENKYLLETTVIKSPNNDYEIIANDHYITFTKRLVLDKPIADYENNPEHREQLINFIDNIVEMDANTQRERELKQEISIDFSDDAINHELINTLIDSKLTADFMDTQAEKSVDDFVNDRGLPDFSRYEASVATACAGHVHRFMINLPYTQVLKDKYADVTENDWIYAAYKMAEFVLPYRDKHDEYRNGLPWLLYQAHGGWTYIRAMHLEKEREKERNR